MAESQIKVIYHQTELNHFTHKDKSSIFELASVGSWVQKCKDIYNSVLIQNPGFEHRDYQYEYAGLYCWRKANICAGAMALGKSLITALAIGAIYGKDIAKRRPGTIQIAVPTVLSGTTRWLVDLNRVPCLYGFSQFINSEQDLVNSNAPIWVYTQDFIKRQSKQMKGTKFPFISRLLIKPKYAPALLVIDEVHHLKPKSQRSNSFAHLIPRAKRVLALSGTLSDGRLDLLNHINSLIYQRHWPYSSNTTFLNEFGTKKKVNTNYATGEQEIIELPTRYLQNLSLNKVKPYFQLIRRFVHRVRLSDPNVVSCITKPETNPHLVKVDMCHSQRLLYSSVLNMHSALIERLAALPSDGATLAQRQGALVILNPLLKACNYPWEYGEAYPSNESEKLRRLLQLVKGGVKSVVFTNHIASNRGVTRYLTDELGEGRVVRLYAQDEEATPKVLSDELREEAVSRFLFDREVKAGVFSINLSAESIDLTQADQVIFYDYPWQSIKLQQAIARCVRPGSPFDVINVFYLVNSGTIDAHMQNLLIQKQKATAQLLDCDFDLQVSADLGTLNPVDLIHSLLNS